MSKALGDLRKYWWTWCFVVPFVIAFTVWTYLEWADRSDGAQQSVDSGYAKEITQSEQITFLKQALPIGVGVGLGSGIVGLVIGTIIGGAMMLSNKKPHETKS